MEYGRFESFIEEIMKDTNNSNNTEFEEKLCTGIKKCKVEKIKILNPPKQDCINKTILDRINSRNKLCHRHQINPENKNIENNFLVERKGVADEIRIMKNDYYQNIFTICKSKPKEM